ncbi:MAG: arylesterase [Magnetococcales bacterium]|nr:arylesterase [Magnetococcales bacterium]
MVSLSPANRILATAIALLLLLSSRVWAAEEPVILCLGDSLTAGLGVGPDEAWPGRLQAHLRAGGYPHKVVNAGVSGDTTAGGLHRLDWVLQTKPTLAILALGANDGLRGLDPTLMEQNLETILQRLQRSGVRTLLAGMRLPPNYGEAYSQTFAEVFPRLAERHRIPLIPFLLDQVAGHKELNLPDGIHPNAQGHGIILEHSVWPVLQPLL